MVTPFLQALSCPCCSSQVTWRSQDSHNGWIDCDSCKRSVPVIEGLVFFNEPFMTVSHEQFIKFKNDTLAKLAVEEVFQTTDPYPAFQPFNESIRCMNRLIPALKEHLSPGQVILDLHNRSGYTGAWLAGMFPDQWVISVWTGPLSYLGAYLTCNPERPSNLLILVTSPDQTFPIRPQSIHFLHGYDSLHFYRQPDFINRAFHACHPHAVLAFPHVHLSNSNPEPFFNRGGELRSGTQYQHFLTERARHFFSDQHKKVMVVGESEFFISQSCQETNPETPCYNGFIWVSDEIFLKKMQYKNIPVLEETMCLLWNPLLSLNPLTNTVHIRYKNLKGKIQYLLDRHLVYLDYIQPYFPFYLSEALLSIIHRAESGLTVKAMLAQGVSLDAIHLLLRADILIEVPEKSGLLQLQRYYRDNRAPLNVDFLECWQAWMVDQHCLIAGSINGCELTKPEAQSVVQLLITFFKQIGVTPGESILIDSQSLCAEIIWVICAIYLGGYHLSFDKAVMTACTIVSTEGLVGVHYQSKGAPTQIDLYRLLEEYSGLPESEIQQDFQYSLQQVHPWYTKIKRDSEGRLILADACV